jgi:SWIM zinc finger
MATVTQHPSTVEYLETLRQALQRDTERCLAAAPIRLTPTPRRNEGGRFSTTQQSAWYAEHEAANIARVEAMDAQAEVAKLAQVVGEAVEAMPEAATRITKAATLVQHKDVWPLTDGTFLVGSQSDTEKAYLVRRGPWACECKAAQHQPGPCKHALAVMLTVKMGRTYQPTYQ